jgi:putative ABC transport system permease protein
LNTLKMALVNIRGNTFRSVAIFLCVMSLSAFLFSTTLVIKGAENSLNVSINRLGADILVVPNGAESKVESALLMGKPTSVWMPRSTMDKIAVIPGIEAVTPQIYLQSLYGASCCSVSEMFMMVYDPQTDFVVAPWLKKTLGRGLQTGEVFGGTYIFVPPGLKGIQLYGSELTLRGNLEATGTGLDQTLFMTIDTAKMLAANSIVSAEQPLEIPDDTISTVMVKIQKGEDRHRIALSILQNVLGVTPIESPNLFGVYRQQMSGLLWGFFAIMIIIWVLSIILIGLVFSMAANERRREIAVLRAIGATRLYAVKSIVGEASLLAFGAGLVGVLLAAQVLFFFKDLLAGSLRMPFLFPSFPVLAMFAVGAVLLSLLTVSFAAFFPALRITGREPAIAMRE